MDTIFALSSGAPPAGIAVVRISGPRAGAALTLLGGSLSAPRSLRLTTLSGADGALLDRALVAWFPGPATVTGEDLAELHLHGGRAVVRAVEAALGAIDGLRTAAPGEFTRRAFANGRIDLAEAEGLADLLAAETETQRLAAVTLAGGALSRQVAGWQARVLALSAEVEAALDFADDDDTAELPAEFSASLTELGDDIAAALEAPSAERLRDGFRVALAGPPNAGKSTLFNALLETEAAITTPLPGTTRDVLERPVALSGIAFTLIDMAGLRDEPADSVEAIGIARARHAIDGADVVLWLGDEGEGPSGSWEIEAQVDRIDHRIKQAPCHRVSAVTAAGMAGLVDDLVATARKTLPKAGEVTLNRRQRACLADARSALFEASDNSLILAENLRLVRKAFDMLTGAAATEDVLETLFGRFCIGK